MTASPGVPDPSAGLARAAGGWSVRLLLAVGVAVVLPLLIGVAVVLKHRQAGSAAAGALSQAVPSTSNAPVLLAIAVVIGAALLGGRAAVALGQPPVVGEILVGIALGPTILGRVHGETMHWLFPTSVLPMLHGLAVIGLVLFMFGVGRELAAVRLDGPRARAGLVTAASVLLPFAVGTLIAVGLAGDYAGPIHNQAALAIFLGCALSVTAVPVLARILADLQLSGSRVGLLSLFAAALGDAVAWLFLALALATARGGQSGDFVQTLLAAAGVTLLLLGPVRWGLRSWVARRSAGAAAEAAGGPDRDRDPDRDPGRGRATGSVPGDGLGYAAPLAIGVAAAAALTAAIGLHEIIGALLAGLICPRGYRPLDVAAERLAGTTRAVLLPVFFAGFGLSLDLAAPALSRSTVLIGAVVLTAAVLTKLAGPGICGRLTGLSWRESFGLGALLNTRGLTELVVIQIGWQAGIIDDRLLAVLVVVSLLTTVMAGPALRLIGRPGRAGADGLETRLPAPLPQQKVPAVAQL